MMVCYTEKDFDPKYQEEIKLKHALRFLKEYCDNHVDCKGCYIASRKYSYEACPCATLVNEVYEHDPGWWKNDCT